MKLASFNDGTIDGKLIIVSKDLKFLQMLHTYLQQCSLLLITGQMLTSKLQNLYEKLNNNLIEKNLFDQEKSIHHYQGLTNGQIVQHLLIT